MITGLIICNEVRRRIAATILLDNAGTMTFVEAVSEPQPSSHPGPPCDLVAAGACKVKMNWVGSLVLRRAPNWIISLSSPN